MVRYFSVLWLIWPPNIPFQQRKSISEYSALVYWFWNLYFSGRIFIFLKFWQHFRPFLAKIGRDNSLLSSDIEYITLIEHFSKKSFSHIGGRGAWQAEVVSAFFKFSTFQKPLSQGANNTTQFFLAFRADFRFSN